MKMNKDKPRNNRPAHPQPRVAKSTNTAKLPKIWSTDIPDRLHAALVDPNGPAVILVQAPTGYGKTALVVTELARLQAETPNLQPAAVLMPFRISVKEMFKFASALNPNYSFGYGMRGDCVQTPKNNCRLFTVGFWLEQFIGSLVKADDDSYRQAFSQAQPCFVLLDEVHDASWQTDLALRLLLWAQSQGYPVRILLASATMNVADVMTSIPKNHLVLSVEQETANVEIHYPPPDLWISPINSKQKLSEEALGLMQTFLSQILDSTSDGDILVIMPGQEEIQLFLAWLEHSSVVMPDGAVVAYPLHSQMNREDQALALEALPKGVRKIIVATNIVENAITIPQLDFVIDSCVRKEMSISEEGITSLQLQLAARSNLDQAAGRVGRLGKLGHCYRILSEGMVRKLKPFSPSESHRNPLYLQIIKLAKEKLPILDILKHVTESKIARDAEFLLDHGAIKVSDSDKWQIVSFGMGNVLRRPDAIVVTRIGEMMAHLHLSLQAGHFLASAIRGFLNNETIPLSLPGSLSSSSDSSSEESETSSAEESETDSEDEENFPDAAAHAKLLPYFACVVACWIDTKTSMFYRPNKRANEHPVDYAARLDTIREQQLEFYSRDCISTMLQVWLAAQTHPYRDQKGGFYRWCKEYGLFDRTIKDLQHTVDHTIDALAKLGYKILIPTYFECINLQNFGISWIIKSMLPHIVLAFAKRIYVPDRSGRSTNYKPLDKRRDQYYSMRPFNPKYFLDRTVLERLDSSEQSFRGELVAALSIHQIKNGPYALSKIVCLPAELLSIHY